MNLTRLKGEFVPDLFKEAEYILGIDLPATDGSYLAAICPGSLTF